MRNVVKFLIVYALWVGYQMCGYAQYMQITIDAATENMVAHTFKITGALPYIKAFYEKAGLIYVE